MVSEDPAQKIVNSLFQFPPCHVCGTRLRFGDYDCPRCEADMEEPMRDWAEKLVDDLGIRAASD
jgi:hypothetical protein